MHAEVEACLRETLPAALQHAACLPQAMVGFWELKRGSGEKGGFTARYDYRPYPPDGPDLCPSGLVKQIHDTMRAHHPEHLGGIGTAEYRSGLSAEVLLRAMIFEIRSRHGTLDVGSEAVDTLIAEFGCFVDAGAIRTAYWAPIENLEVEPEVAVIELPAGVRIRPLSDAEITELFARSMQVASIDEFLSFPRLPGCAFVGEFDDPKFFSDQASPMPTETRKVWATLQPAVTALRCFKAGPVGCRDFHTRPIGFYPVLRRRAERWGSEIPDGRYLLAADEVDALQAFARHVMGPVHEALEIAVSRLSDAELRGTPRDKLIDSVIGMEAMLLHGETQELSYKFALRYASLSERPEQRLRDFEDARAIYKCRSLLAHGERVRDDHAARIGGRWVSLHEAAETASAMLRRLLQCFLPDGVSPGFLRRDYWERRLFDTPDAERSARAE